MSLTAVGHLAPVLPEIAFRKVLYDGTYIYICTDVTNNAFDDATRLNIYSFDGANYSLLYSHDFASETSLATDGTYIYVSYGNMQQSAFLGYIHNSDFSIYNKFDGVNFSLAVTLTNHSLNPGNFTWSGGWYATETYLDAVAKSGDSLVFINRTWSCYGICPGTSTDSGRGLIAARYAAPNLTYEGRLADKYVVFYGGSNLWFCKDYNNFANVRIYSYPSANTFTLVNSITGLPFQFTTGATDGTYFYLSGTNLPKATPILRAYDSSYSLIGSISEVGTSDISKVWCKNGYVFASYSDLGIKVYTFDGSNFSQVASDVAGGIPSNIDGDVPQYIHLTTGTDGVRAYDLVTVSADFSADLQSAPAPLTSNFTDLSTGAVSWSWDFGDGGTSTLQNPTYTYMNVGVYTVTLSVNGGAATNVKTDYITVTASADFTATPTDGYVGMTTSFTDTSIGATSWAWTFGDGETSTLQNPTHTYTKTGLYTITLTINSGESVKTQTDYITVSGLWLVNMTDGWTTQTLHYGAYKVLSFEDFVTQISTNTGYFSEYLFFGTMTLSSDVIFTVSKQFVSPAIHSGIDSTYTSFIINNIMDVAWPGMTESDTIGKIDLNGYKLTVNYLTDLEIKGIVFVADAANSELVFDNQE